MSQHSQWSLDTLLAPTDQLVYTTDWDPSPVSRELAITGNLNPVFEEAYKSEHGRYLSGTEAMNGPDDENVLERDQHNDIYETEDMDDVLGSGIFDPFDRPGTANTDTGVFTSHYSLPGYLAREIPFTTSTDVTDLTDDASIVTVPGGGMAYVEARGKLVGPASLGPQPPPPHLRPPPPTGRDQSYVSLTASPPRGWDADSLLRAAETMQAGRHASREVRGRAAPPVGVPGNGSGRPFPVPAEVIPPARMAPDTRYHPTAQAASGFGDIAPRGVPAFPYAPGSPSMYRPFPPGHPARDPMFHVAGVPTMPRHGQVPLMPQPHRVPQRSYVFPQGANIAIGQTEQTDGASSTKTLLAYAAAGLAVGVALKIFTGAMSK